MEAKRMIKHIEEVEEDIDLPWLDSPVIPKSEAGGCVNKPCDLLVETRRGKYKKFKLNSAPLLFKKSFKGVRKFKIEDLYTLKDTLGVGTYGEVKLGVKIDTNEIVAIKIAKGTTSTKTLENEAKILKEIDSEFIPKFYDFHIDSVLNKSYLVMEYIKGWTISEILEKRIVNENINSRNVLSQLTQAVKTLHEKGFCHRDIKPENVMITDDGNVKLIDFNICKKSKIENEVMTKKFTGKFFTQVSSPLFAAPELSSLDWYTESVDIWGIGVIYASILIREEIILLLKSNKTDLLNALPSWKNQINDYEFEILSQLLNSDYKSRPTAVELESIIA